MAIKPTTKAYTKHIYVGGINKRIKDQRLIKKCIKSTESIEPTKK